MRTRKSLTSLRLTIPKTGNRQKINLEHLSYVRPPQKWLFSVHVCHAFHHKLTIKTPRSTTRFLKIPCKTPQTTTSKKNDFIAS
jgi:hypothetical protein